MRRLAALTFVLLAGTAADAAAHGLDGSAADKSTLGFLPLGIEHMLLGWDHLAFICGVVLIAGSISRAAKLISVFVAAHSSTLIIATLAGWRVSPTAVDVVIALSVVFVGVVGLRGRPSDWTRFYGAVAVFGLIHGFGLSTRLQDLGLPEEGELGRIIAFNVGLEIGQLGAIAVFVGLVTLLTRYAPKWEQVRRVAYGALAAAGLIAAGILSFPGDDDDETVAETPRVSANCVEAKSDPPRFRGGGHPESKFLTEVTEDDETDLVHVITDGYVVVRYRPDLPATQIRELEGWIGTSGKALNGAPKPGQAEPIVVVAAYRTLTCTSFDIPAAKEFSERWFADVRAGTFR